MNFTRYLPGVLKKGSLICAVKLFLLENFLNQFDLITNSFIFLVFNFNWSLILLLEGYLFGVPGS